MQVHRIQNNNYVTNKQANNRNTAFKAVRIDSTIQKELPEFSKYLKESKMLKKLSDYLEPKNIDVGRQTEELLFYHQQPIIDFRVDGFYSLFHIPATLVHYPSIPHNSGVVESLEKAFEDAYKKRNNVSITP